MTLTKKPGQKRTPDSGRVKFLYESYGKLLQRYSIKNYQVSDDEAWDLVYKTIYRVAELDPAMFEDARKLKGYIFRSQINNIYNHLRDTRKFSVTNVATADLPEDDIAATENGSSVISPQMKILHEELEKLEDWQRILLLMRGQDASYKTISELVNRPEKQLKVYYGRLKQQLLKNINQQLKLISNEDK